MASNKIKHKLLKMEKKYQQEKQKLDNEEKKHEADELKEFYERKKEKLLELLKLKEKIYYAKRKSAELDKEFKLKNQSKYPNKEEFKKAYLENKNKRHEVIQNLTDEYIDAKLAYAYEFETTTFKIKRWFYGILKEVNRISWLSKRNALYAFGVVVSITLFLSLLFLIINLIFLKGI